jgi:hypothetical protein
LFCHDFLAISPQKSSEFPRRLRGWGWRIGAWQTLKFSGEIKTAPGIFLRLHVTAHPQDGVVATHGGAAPPKGAGIASYMLARPSALVLESFSFHLC